MRYIVCNERKPILRLYSIVPTMSESDNDSWQSADWLSDELFSYCQSEMLSEDGLREIIEHNNDQHDVSDDYSFFRMACCNEECTEEIIRCLLE